MMATKYREAYMEEATISLRTPKDLYEGLDELHSMTLVYEKAIGKSKAQKMNRLLSKWMAELAKEMPESQEDEE